MPHPTDYLSEISHELAQFDPGAADLFRCPICFRDLPVEDIGSTDDNLAITEEHIIPRSVGGRLTTFLGKECNSSCGSKQTKWLSSWIELNEGRTPFHKDPKNIKTQKKQRATFSADGHKLGGSIRLAEDGAIEFYTEKSRSNPKDYDAHSLGPKPTEVEITYRVPVFANEEMLNVGFLTAAYELWFKNFGYSWVLQSSLNIVRKQILNPEANVISWNYLYETASRDIKNPSIGLMRFSEKYFPFALIYDHIVILPSARYSHPPSTKPDQISIKPLALSPPIANRYQSRRVGPAILSCNGQEVVSPDLIATPTQHVRLMELRCSTSRRGSTTFERDHRKGPAPKA